MLRAGAQMPSSSGCSPQASALPVERGPWNWPAWLGSEHLGFQCSTRPVQGVSEDCALEETETSGWGAVTPESPRPGAAVGAICPGVWGPPSPCPGSEPRKAKATLRAGPGGFLPLPRGLLATAQGAGPRSGPCEGCCCRGGLGWGAWGEASSALTHGTPLAGAANPGPKTPLVLPLRLQDCSLRRQMGTRKGVGRQGRVSGFPSLQGGPCSDFPKCVRRSSPSPAPRRGCEGSRWRREEAQKEGIHHLR